jgi:hypothetical protein
MTASETKQFIVGGEWISVATELRPSAIKTPTGEPKPFYCSRIFNYSPKDVFECTLINYADPNGRTPLVKIIILGHLAWKGDHPVAEGAYMLDYVADLAYMVTPLHQAFADAINQFPAPGLEKWEVNIMQDIKEKRFPPFGLHDGEIYTDYDLMYIYENLLFNGSKHVDGRAFDKPENRPTNFQVPLIRKNTPRD